MKPEWLVGVSMLGYGVSLGVGIGVPIPVLDEEVVKAAAVRDEEIYAQITDYSEAYPQMIPGSLGEVNYAQLKTGKIVVRDKQVPVGSLSSYSRAREIAEELKSWIKKGDFLLTDPVAQIPNRESGYAFKALKERPF
jgi:uncharacterized protein (DUF39 family)